MEYQIFYFIQQGQLALEFMLKFHISSHGVNLMSQIL